MTVASIVEQLEALDAQILAEYAAGLSMTAISKKLSVELDDVTAAVTDFAEMDRGKARDLALAWQRTAKAATWRAQRDAQTDTQPEAQRHTAPAPIEVPVEPKAPARPTPHLDAVKAERDQVRDALEAARGDRDKLAGDLAEERRLHKLTVVERERLTDRVAELEALLQHAEQYARDLQTNGDVATADDAIYAAEAIGDATLKVAAANARDMLAELAARVAKWQHDSSLREELEQIEARAAEIRAQLEPAKADAYKRPDRAESAAIRQWARQTNREVHDTGMLPRALVEAYRAAVAR